MPGREGLRGHPAGEEEMSKPEAEELRKLNMAMDRYADGDDEAFADVYDLLAPRLFRFFAHQVDRCRAEDLVQQTLLQMHAARRNYATGSDVSPWAFAIGRNVLVDARRRSRNEVLFQTTGEEAAATDGGLDRESNPDDLATTKEMIETVREELARLPVAQREAFDLVRREGLSVAQTAEALGITSTAVKLRVHRVYEALRRALGVAVPAH
jgi:RNA polymerase sigma-70 factor (ECF subfamily)